MGKQFINEKERGYVGKKKRKKNKNKDVYIIKDNKIYSAIYRKGDMYIRIINSNENILIKKNRIFKSFKKAEKFLNKQKLSNQRYKHKMSKRKRIKDRIFDLEDSMFWSIKAMNRKEITSQQSEATIQKHTKEIRKLKKILNKK